MSTPDGWTPEEAERLAALGRGECPHDNVMVVSVPAGATVAAEIRWSVCTDCYLRVRAPEDVDDAV